MEGAQASGGVEAPGTGAATPDPPGDAARQHGACLNCGAALIGPHCHQCGQKAHVHRTLGAFFHDLLHGVLHFEGKVWRTLPLLLWKPGELTRRYVEGERARFISPLAMFLFSVFLMFAVVGSIGGEAFEKRNAAAGQKEPRPIGISPFDSVPVLRQEIIAERQENRKELEDLNLARQKLAAAGKKSDVLDADIANLRRETALEEQVFQQALELQRAEERRSETHKKPVAGVEMHPRASKTSAPYDKGYEFARRNPDLILYKLQTNAYKYSWVLIPLLVPFVSLLFLRRRHRRFKLYDHAVFVTYSLSFLSLFVIAYTLLSFLGMSGRWSLLPFIILPIHAYKQLRGGYLLSRFGALWRTAALLTFSLLVCGLFFIILISLEMSAALLGDG